MVDYTGQYFGRYYLAERLGEGGMAVVYKAYDTRLERDVAIKIIRRETFSDEALKEVLKRFEREAKSLAKLSHPNIVKVHDYGEYEGSPYLVMEYLPGGTLKKMLREPIPWQEAVRLILPVARGVSYAHQRGVLHRDIKPANILITESGEPMLSDFGIAKMFEGEQTTVLTESGMAIGTPDYMAPEQWEGVTNPYSDQYSLGIVLYELVTGRKPYEADTPGAILIKQVTEPLPSPRVFNADLPETLERILIKTLAREPGERFNNLDAFINELEKNHASASAVLSQVETEIEPEVVVAEELKPTSVVSGKRKSAPIKLSRTRMGLLGSGAILVLVVWLGLPIIGKLTFPEPTFTATFQVQESPAEPIVETSSPTLTPTKSPTPRSTAIPSEITDGKGVDLVLVRAGNFWMGGDGFGDFPDERPFHQVYLDAFYIDKYEVTNVLYKECVDVGVCDPPTATSRYNNSQFAQHPVVNVTWNMAREYCEWRDGRLPTEAEWEKAARGTDRRYYPWSNDSYNIDCLDANFYDALNANYCVRDTTPVGSYESGLSPYGAYDLAGNVMEWVADWYDRDYYENSPWDNPLGPDSGGSRVLRGGSWSSPPHDVSTANRDGADPQTANNVIGFRCAGSVP